MYSLSVGHKRADCAELLFDLQRVGVARGDDGGDRGDDHGVGEATEKLDEDRKHSLHVVAGENVA